MNYRTVLSGKLGEFQEGVIRRMIGRTSNIHENWTPWHLGVPLSHQSKLCEDRSLEDTSTIVPAVSLVAPYFVASCSQIGRSCSIEHF
jgi:hypothetical protein